MPSFATRIIAGFIAGALAVLIFHQGMYLLMQQYGGPYGIKLGGTPWRTAPIALWPELFAALKMQAISVPAIASQSIWGGLWGILFAFMVDRLPGGLTLIKGFVFACIFPMLLGSWLLVAMVKGNPILGGAMAKGGFDIMALRNGFLLNGVGFGIGLGLLYPLLAGRMRRGD